MKIKVSAETMLPALKATSRLIKDKTSIPILSYFLLKADADELTIKTSNDEGASMSHTIKVDKDITESFAVCVMQEIKDIFSLIKGDACIEYAEGETSLTISCKEGNFTIPCVDADGYPEQEFKTDTETYVSTDIPVAKFCDGISFCSRFIDDNILRPVMGAVRVEINGGELCIAGTDAQKLAVYADSAEGCPDFEVNMVGRYADMLGLFAGENAVNLTYNGKAIMVSTLSCSCVIPCIEGNYPKFRRIIPTSESETASTIIKKAEILRSLAMVNICTDKSSKLVKIAVSGETMTISGEDKPRGNKASGYASCESADFLVGMNLGNVVIALNSLPCESVRVGFTSEDRPLVLTCVGDDKYKVVVMPVTMQN